MADENSDVSELKNKIKELLKLEIGNKIQLEHLLNDFILKGKPLSKSDHDYVNKLLTVFFCGLFILLYSI